ncbi:MAG: LON peptidase substrate-binding domain-containing protein [Rhodocyclaceae bacterium]|nr:LON peptidase substrate-binding domain-containing protein [Rhodocyclaceae bacterium]
MEIPLFLLNTVLYPGGRLELRVFETRYMDMVKERLRADAPFGVCLLERGEEVAAAKGEETVPHRIGTLANIVDWEMPQFGILNVVTNGGARFRVLDYRTLPDGLVRATVEMLPEPPVTPIPGDYARLVPMLRGLIDALEDAPPQPYRFFDAAWVADRWAELLPLPLELRQRVLEMDDGIARLDAIYRFLEQEAG